MELNYLSLLKRLAPTVIQLDNDHVYNQSEMFVYFCFFFNIY